MADQSTCNDTAQKLRAMARQAGCLAEYLRRGDVEMAHWLLRELKSELHELDDPT
jgi:ribosomal protein S15P/S13E